MNRVFADTFYWVALVNRQDTRHRVALEWGLQARSTIILTTEEVLTELLAFCSSDEWLRCEAVKIVRRILTSSKVSFVPQSHASFLDGLALYENRPDKAYSLTDCIAMQIMRREGITEVLSNDKHFEQEGFRALFRNAGLSCS